MRGIVVVCWVLLGLSCVYAQQPLITNVVVIPSNTVFFRLRYSPEVMEPLHYTNRAYFINSSSVAVSNLSAETGIDWSHRSHHVARLEPGQTSRWETVYAVPVPTYGWTYPNPAGWSTGEYEQSDQIIEFEFMQCGFFLPDRILTINDGAFEIE